MYSWKDCPRGCRRDDIGYHYYTKGGHYSYICKDMAVFTVTLVMFGGVLIKEITPIMPIRCWKSTDHTNIFVVGGCVVPFQRHKSLQHRVAEHRLQHHDAICCHGPLGLDRIPPLAVTRCGKGQ